MLSNLAWLPAAPQEFRAETSKIKADLAAGSTSEAWSRLRLLCATALNTDQLSNVARLVARLIESGDASLPTLKLGIVGDATLSFLSPAIAGSCIRYGIATEVVEGNYGGAVQDALDEGSALRAAGLDMALIVTDARIAGLDRPPSTSEAAARQVDAALAQVRLIATNLRGSVRSAIFVQTIVPPLEPLFGSFDRLEAISPLSMVDAFNRGLAEMARGGDIVLVDVAQLANTVGLEQWHDARHWHASKLSFSPSMLPVYGEIVARVIASVRGLARKCLVLDLDNTLWGGVIGDDGLAGIALGQGSATGEAFLAIQQLALDLRARGVILAVCSKNEDDAARLPFREHPDMLLREEHIAVFQANWTDKATNLKAIAQTLNIGVDSLVFLDDNPAEREQVRRELPMVAVPEVGDDPTYYPRILAAAGYFEAVSFSGEDRERADFYQANAERVALQSGASDMEGYLRSLDMVCRIEPVDPVCRARVAQLINKSNQFNLTTRRYSEAEVAALEGDPAVHLFQVRLSDRFGDNGIISVVIAHREGDQWEIGTWLMSCRVLGRRVESAVLTHLVAAAQRDGAALLVGRYIPTAKNKLVVEHYAKLGFEQAGSKADGTTIWTLDLSRYEAPELPMQVIDERFASQGAD